MVDKQYEKPKIHDGYFWYEQSCPICRSLPTRRVGKRGGASHRSGLGVETIIWQCKKCSLIFPNPMPVPIEGLGQHYDVDPDEYFSHHEKDSKNTNAADLVTQAEELVGRKGKMLDIGIGRGEIITAALDAGWTADGVEPSETFADYVENLTSTKIWRQPFEESEIPDCEYDAVILSAVLEHLYDPNAAIAKISRILKPGGILFVDVPNELGLYFRIGNLYQKLRRRD